MSDGGLRRRHAGGARDDGERPNRLGARRITLETFDLYQKVAAEESVKTSTGGSVSLVSLLVILVLVAGELYRYLVPVRMEHMVVDRVIEGRVRINFDITFPALTCLDTNLDAMDVAGEQQNGIDHDIQKMRLDGATGRPIGSAFSVKIEARPANGSAGGDDHGHGAEGADATAAAVAAKPTPLPADYCGSCFGAESAVPERPSDRQRCCNTCDEVKNSYQAKGWDAGEVGRSSEQCLRDHAGDPSVTAKEGEGCRISGFMLVNKVAGNFHIAMGETHARGAGHIHQFNPAVIAKYNVTHTIHTLSFGLPFPGQHNPLDGTLQQPREGAGVYMYYIKVVPTTFLPRGGANVTTNQYSVTSQYRPAIVDGQRQNVLPGLFFVYDFSPFMVTVNDQKTTTLAQLVTSLCAILGGVITAARLADAVLYRLSRTIKAGGSAGGATGSQALVADALIGAVGSVQRAAGSAAASVVAAGASAVAAGGPAGLGAAGLGVGGGKPAGFSSKFA